MLDHRVTQHLTFWGTVKQYPKVTPPFHILNSVWRFLFLHILHWVFVAIKNLSPKSFWPCPGPHSLWLFTMSVPTYIVLHSSCFWRMNISFSYLNDHISFKTYNLFYLVFLCICEGEEPGGRDRYLLNQSTIPGRWADQCSFSDCEVVDLELQVLFRARVQSFSLELNYWVHIGSTIKPTSSSPIRAISPFCCFLYRCHLPKTILER